MSLPHRPHFSNKSRNLQPGTVPYTTDPPVGLDHFILVDTAPDILAAARRAAERLGLVLLVERSGTFTGIQGTREDWNRVWLEAEVEALVDRDRREHDPDRAAHLAQVRRRKDGQE